MATRQLASAILVALVLLAPAAAFAQRADFVELERVEIEELSNAVRLRLTADGALDVYGDTRYAYMDWTRATAQALPEAQAGPSRRISFVLRNVRSGAAAVVQVAKYPVSHLEFFLLPFGDYIVATVVLYRPGYLTFARTDWTQDLTQQREYEGPQVMIEITRKKNELLVTVLSDRPQEPPPTRPEVKPAPAQLEVSGDADHLNVYAVNADIHLLLAGASHLAQVEVYVDDKVDLEVTAHLEEVALERLLQTLVVGYGLSLRRETGAYFLSLTEADTAVPFWTAETRSVPVRYLSASEAVLLLPDVLLSYVRANEEGNALVMNGPPSLLDRIEQDLRAIDRPAYHCRLRAWVVSGQDVGERLQEITARAAGGTTLWQGDSSGQVRLEVDERRAHELLAGLRRLGTRQRLHIKTLPVVQVKNGQQARLFVGEKIYYWKLSASWTHELDSVEAGCELEIEPLTGGEWINASVKVKSSFLGDTNRLGPLIFRRSAEGTVRLRSGDTVIIGGLRLADVTKGRRKTAAGLAGRYDYAGEQEVWVLLQARASLAPIRNQDNLMEVVS